MDLMIDLNGINPEIGSTIIHKVQIFHNRSLDFYHKSHSLLNNYTYENVALSMYNMAIHTLNEMLNKPSLFLSIPPGLGLHGHG